MESLATFLKRRTERSYRNLLQQIEGLSAEEALAGSHPNWPDQRWGIGQNGSIAGIVYHVAAWKQMALAQFQPGGRPLSRDEFDTEAAPSPDDWQGIQAWLKQVGMAWNAEVAALSEEAFDLTITWDGFSFPFAKFVTEMYEHDIQHASQIEYLRQRLLISHRPNQ